jgi:putative DNA primase/helicase
LLGLSNHQQVLLKGFFDMHIHDVRAAARALDGDVSGRDGVLCPGPGHSRQDRSLSVRFDPSAPNGFVVYSHAGDPIADCKDHVRERLGLAPWRPRHRDNARPTIRRHVPEPPADQHAKHLSFARSIWEAAKPAKGTLVERYLVETRRLELPETDAIRFHPRLRVTHTNRFAPAMVCRMSDIRTDEFTGVHRTFLTDTAQKISKTILGRKHGSAIKIDGAEGAGLAIAEGVETTIAARYLYRPAWSVIDAGGMRHFPVLPAIEHLEIFADHDVNGAGEAAARECLARWENAGAEVAIVMPPTAGSDIADFIAKRKVY